MKSTRHEIEIEDWQYEIKSYFLGKTINIFVEDPTKQKYSIMDIVKLINKDTRESHSRLIVETTTKDRGLAEGYVMLTLGLAADFDNECIATAVIRSLGKL